ncbi:Clavaminate synthase-like protein [Cadophora sp. DSE1049]|nr:Clavaminate synthase-like protein [Cadophora sp. DSE1049]
MATRALPEALRAPLQTFENIPPFPKDVPKAPLLRLSLSKLLDRDAGEVNRLIRACEDLGFFYLDLSCPAGKPILTEADELFKVSTELFELPLEEKKKYDFIHKNSYYGYKGLGLNAVDSHGNLDRNEFYNANDIFELSDPWPAPNVLNSRRPLLKSFISSAYGIVTLVLTLLNNHLHLPPNTLQDLHRLEGHSGDIIRFIRSPPQPVDDRRTSLAEHTDFGSVTVLFNRLGGLQVLPPGRDAQWCYVQPLPNHAIINLGDAMVKFTNSLLRSNIHRVTAPPGEQADYTRFSLVYFSRPNDDVMLKRLEGSDIIPPLEKDEVEEQISSKDWINRRTVGRRVDLHGKKAFDNNRIKGTETRSKRAHL